MLSTRSFVMFALLGQFVSGAIVRVALRPAQQPQLMRLISSPHDFVSSPSQVAPLVHVQQARPQFVQQPQQQQPQRFVRVPVAPRPLPPAVGQRPPQPQFAAAAATPIINRVLPASSSSRVQTGRATVDKEDEPVTQDPPRPYSIAYDSVDGNGTTMSREEVRDDKGVVKGSYSYTDPFGIFRVVEYIADENGFRASIRTNEPGVGKSDNGDPSGVIYEIDPPPPARAAAASA